MNFKYFIEQDEEEIPMSKKEFEEMAQRVYYRNREFLKEYGYMTWMQWVNQESTYNLSLVFPGDFEIYDRYLRRLPEGIHIMDIIQAYKDGKLSDKDLRPAYKFQASPITTKGKWHKMPWSPKRQKPMDAKKIYATASQRITKSNQKEVSEARKQLLILFNTDEKLSDKLGIKKSELNKKIKNYSNYPASTALLERQLNAGVPEQHQWMGLRNSNFLNRASFLPEDVDKFVKNIEVTSEGMECWRADRGEILRNYIARTLMSIDTGLQYKDLSFIVGKCEANDDKHPPRGRYKNNKKTIVISDVNPHTVAHEIGHYLDYKFEAEVLKILKFNIQTGLSRNHMDIRGEEPLLQWARKYKAFVKNLMDKGDIYSEYTQDPAETFARFINYFVNWTVLKSGGHTYGDDYRNDKFTEADCRTWVKLLQEKSAI